MQRGRSDHAPRLVVPWVSFGARTGLPSPLGPVAIVAEGTPGAPVVPALASAVLAAARADRAEAWREIAARRNWSVARAHSMIGDSLSAAISLAIGESAVASLTAYASRLHQLGLLATRPDVEAAIEPSWLPRAQRLARSELGAVA